ncbi:hypothetical protein [Thorsellia anophelis]|uniref:Uncharacterized protein n=1 Tax=Thorsellia anophelis DSM 18579 TaxID=1123402 RepID=A0A1H9Z654_9GAMM|nr:hypothetical protein [Thorsellia anophelis]SES77037.1 hypothetical protein SAMN02583745_00441 [Thorsellia anophelis DSM 18579]
MKFKKSVLLLALAAIFTSSMVQAAIRESAETDPIQGRKPYIDQILITGKLYEGQIVSLKPDPKRIYQPLDKDLDIKESPTTAVDGIFLGDLSLSTVEWFLLEKDDTEILGSSVKLGDGIEIPIPAGAAGKKLAYRITPKSTTGIPKIGDTLSVPDVTQISGQDEDGDPKPPVIPPVDKGPDPGPDPENPDIIGPDPTTLGVQIFIADALGNATDKYILDEIGHLSSENKVGLSEVNTTYVVKIVSKGKSADGSEDRDFSDVYQHSVIWRLKDGDNPHIILDGTQTVGPDTTAIDTTGKLSFTTQLNNLVAQAKHSTNLSEQGMTLSVQFNDGTK